MKKENDCFEVERLKKEIRKLQIPKEYFNFDLEKINDHDISMIMSIRKDAAKTTQALIIGLILHKLYDYETEYFRIDTDQTTGPNIDNIYDVIVKFGYIKKIFGDEYNGIEFKNQSKRFYLVKKDDEGNVLIKDKRPCCLIHSLEQYKRMKSVYNNVNGNWFVVDEIFDTSRQTTNQMIELANQISTVTRDRPEARVLMLGNNLNKYSFWFEEFGISEEIDTLNFGGYIDKTTIYGTTLYITLLDPSRRKKDDVLKRKIRFYGIDNPKMAAFNGLQAFAGNQWQHLEDIKMLDPDHLIYDRIYINHRNRWIKICLYDSGNQLFVYLHFAKKPKYNDNIILQANPDLADANLCLYGFGEESRNEKIRKKLLQIKDLRRQNLWFYSSNSVGDIVQDYLMTIR